MDQNKKSNEQARSLPSLGDKVSYKSMWGDWITGTVVVIDRDQYCCANETDGWCGWCLNEDIVNRLVALGCSVLHNWKDFEQQLFSWSCDVAKLSETEASGQVCKECDGTGILHLGFYDRKCGCQLR